MKNRDLYTNTIRIMKGICLSMLDKGKHKPNTVNRTTKVPRKYIVQSLKEEKIPTYYKVIRINGI